MTIMEPARTRASNTAVHGQPGCSLYRLRAAICIFFAKCIIAIETREVHNNAGKKESGAYETMLVPLFQSLTLGLGRSYSGY